MNRSRPAFYSGFCNQEMNEAQDVVIFTEALRLQGDARADYLGTACGADGELRQRVEKLLRAFDSAGDFLDRPALGLPSEPIEPASPIETVGSRVGRYKLLQQIGEGGCGVVFMAEQEEAVRRVVALKVIKPGMDTKNVIARFEAERQALALMDHPGIARVFDAGATASGRPFFVMELVRGLKITDYCDHHSLSTAARLDLFIQVCGAVQHAHQKGIIHRDIKPSNILVTTSANGKPTPKVIDFGIAKATTGQPLTDKTLFTAFEMLIGTPAYMSPEQAELASIDVDTRTDIYSLGVLLYELLTGTIPFDTQELLKSGLDEVRRVIRTRDPVRPSTRLSAMTEADLKTVSQHRHLEPPRLIREVRGDLDWIVMKAMEKDRNRRYATANGLALDVERFLHKDAVLARPPSATYKLRKLFLRNKLLFIGLGLIILLLTGALVVTARLLVMERRAHRLSDALRLESLANEYARATKLDEAVAAVRQSLTIRRQYLDGEPPVPQQLFAIVEILTAHNRQGDATDLLNQALTLAARERPEYLELRTMRVDLLARTAHWQEAATESMALVQRQPDNNSRYHMAAPIAIAATNLAAYHELCSNMVARFGHTTDPFVADAMAKDCLIHPAAGVDLKAVAAMAKVAVTAGNGSSFYYYFQCCEAMAEYRLGNYSEALNWANESAKIDNPNTQAADFAVITMSQLELGDTKAAQQALSDCHQVFDQKLPKIGQDLGVAYRDWIIARSWQAEADALMSNQALTLSAMKRTESLELLTMRVDTLARAAHWQQAATESMALVKIQPGNSDRYHMAAPLAIAATNMATYHDLCSNIVVRFCHTTDPMVADRMAKDCLIHPAAGVDLKAVAAMAKVAVTKGKGSAYYHYFQCCEAMAEYRLGNYSEALHWANGSAAANYPDTRAEADTIIAMSHYKLGDVKAAQQALNDCRQVMDQKLPKMGQDLGPNYRDWIILQAWLTEADDLINRPVP
jgi:serine/threonine protein kinase